jgi:hypothetical protein
MAFEMVRDIQMELMSQVWWLHDVELDCIDNDFKNLEKFYTLKESKITMTFVWEKLQIFKIKSKKKYKKVSE